MPRSPNSPSGPPENDGGWRADRWWVIPIAAVLATIGALIAPKSWQAGPGSLELTVAEQGAVDVPVPIGATEAFEVAGSTSEISVVAEVPEGIPTDSEIVIEVRATDAQARPVELEPSELTVGLVLTDGAREPVPVLRYDEDTNAVVAVRRPPVHSAVVLALLLAVIVLWISEIVPLYVTSLAIPVVLAASGATTATEALAPFFNPIIVLFFAGFLMAEAMRRVSLDELAATSIVAMSGRGPRTLFTTLLVTAAVASMWMSNTAAVALLLPIALTITEPLKDLGYRKAVVLAVAYGATTGGVGSAIGTPANPLAIEFLASFVGVEITFAEWFAFGLPFVVMFLPVIGVYVWWRSSVEIAPARFDAVVRSAKSRRADAGRLTGAQIQVLVVFSVVLALWISQAWTGLNIGIVALGGAVALMVLGKIRTGDLARISWPTLLTFGGGLTLGFALIESGTTDWVVTRLDFLADVPPFLTLLAVAFVTLALTTVASNTASAAMLVPLAIPLAAVVGVDPVLMVVVVAIASSIDYALVVGTPPTMLAYGTGLFTAGEIFRKGIILDIAGVLLLVTAVVSVWRLFGLV